MKLGITQQDNISQGFLELIDFIEIKEITKKNVNYFSSSKRPFLFHCQNFSQRKLVWASDDDFVNLITSNEVKEIIQASFFPWFSFHLALGREKVRIKKEGKKVYFIGYGKRFSRKQLLSKICKNISETQKAYPSFKLAFESSPFLPETISKGVHKHICEPDFFYKVIKETDCFFLLDIGHCLVSAYNLGYTNPKDYFLKLPLEKTLEIHIHRPMFARKDNLWYDAHLPISQREFSLLKWLLPRAKNAQAIVLEAQGLHSEKTLIRELKMLRSL